MPCVLFIYLSVPMVTRLCLNYNSFTVYFENLQGQNQLCPWSVKFSLSMHRFTNLNFIFAKASLITGNFPFLHEVAYLGSLPLSNASTAASTTTGYVLLDVYSANFLCILNIFSYELCTKLFEGL